MVKLNLDDPLFNTNPSVSGMILLNNPPLINYINFQYATHMTVIIFTTDTSRALRICPQKTTGEDVFSEKCWQLEVHVTKGPKVDRGFFHETKQ